MQTFLAIPSESSKDIRLQNEKFCANLIEYDKKDDLDRSKKLIILEKNEYILSCKDIENCNLACIMDGSWMTKEPRFLNFPKKTEEVLPVIIKSEKIEQPIIQDKSLRNLYKQKNFAEFANLAEKFIFEHGHKNDLFILYYLSIIYYYKLDKLRDAQDKLALLLGENDNLAEAWCLLGDYFLSSRQLNDAKKAFELAIEKGRNRNIYDDLPIWPIKYDTYPNKRLLEIRCLLDSTKVLSVNNF